LLLADEPTGNLDPLNKDRVLDILFQYANDNAATLITVTHDHDILHRFQRVIDFKDFYIRATQQRLESIAEPM
jgi:putative ABC transport system ATP-binding protein